MNQEARKVKRFAVQLPCTCGSTDGTLDGTILNLSAQGCALTAECLPSKGSYLSLDIDLLNGEVRWKGLREIERGAMIAADGHFLILGTEGHLAAARISARKLEIVSQTPKPVIAAPAYSFPALHRGLLYLRNERELIALDLRK